MTNCFLVAILEDVLKICSFIIYNQMFAFSVDMDQMLMIAII